MKERILLLRYNLAFIYKKYRLYRLKYVQSKWIFSRVACLGKDAIISATPSINIKHPQIWNQFKCNGLMPDGEIEENYKKLFNKLRECFGDVPIIFIHYPSKLDQREKFIQRGKMIKRSISKLKPSFEPFYDIHADNAVVDFHEDDKFPYHYSNKTYKNIASKIMELDIFKDRVNV